MTIEEIRKGAPSGATHWQNRDSGDESVFKNAIVKYFYLKKTGHKWYLWLNSERGWVCVEFSIFHKITKFHFLKIKPL